MDEAEPAEIPEWLQGLDAVEEPESEVPSEPPAVEMEEAEPAEIPDWLQELASEPHTAALDEGLDDADPTEVPDWLQELEPEAAEFDTPVTGLTEELAETEPVETPDWLRGLEEETKKTEPAALATSEELSEADTAEIPDWLQGLGEGPKPTQVVPPDEKEDAGPVEIPDWLGDLEEDIAVITPPSGVTGWLKNIDEEELDKMVIDYQPGELPDWLENIVSERKEEEIRADQSVKIPADEIETDETLGWVQGLDEVDPEPEMPVEIPSDDLVEMVKSEVVETDSAPDTAQPDFDFEDADAAMAWLEGLAAKQGISEDELISRPEDRPETLPGWLQEETETPVEGISAESPEEAPALFAEQPEAEELDKTPILEEPEPTTEPEMAIPDWLQEVDEPDASQPVDIEPVSETVSEDTAPTEEQLQPEIEFEDADAAMAWLEGLAAKQGVSEDELISRPEDRSEKPPDWVQQEVKPSIVDDAADIPDWLLPDSPVDEKQLDPEETTTSEKAVGFTIDPVAADFSEDIPEFLREIISEEATQDELDFETKEVEPEPLEPVTDTLQVETPSDEFPDWLKQADDEVDREDILEIAQEQPLEDIPEWFQESPEGEPEKIFDEMEEEEISVETIVEPGPEVAPTSIDEPLGSIVDEVESGTPPPTDEKTEPDHGLEFEPPGWVLTGEAPEDEEYQWLPTEPQELDPETGKLLDLNEASMIQLERLTPLGFRRAQAIIVHRDEHGPFESLSDLLSVPGIDQETLNALFSDLTVTPGPAPASIPEKPTPEQPVEIEAEDEDHAQQLEARLDLANGNLDQAIIKYEKLIQEGKYLDHIIADLDQALSTEFPKENYVDLLQALGDAYLKADRLQDALDTYTKAEELLR